MPAQECLVQSKGCPPVYRLRDGRLVEVRNGCLIDTDTCRVICGSNEAAEFLLANAILTTSERRHLEEFGREAFLAMARASEGTHAYRRNQT